MALRRNLILGLKRLFFSTKDFPSNVIVTASHGTSKVPLSIFPHLRPVYQSSPRLLLNFSDFGTKYLVKDVPETQRVIPRYGRIVGDPNRKREDPEIIRFKDFGGVPIFRESFEKKLTTSFLRPFHLRKLLKLSYEPYYKDIFTALEKAIKNTKDTGLPIILVDIHDTGNRILGHNWRADKIRTPWKMPSIVISSAPDLPTKLDQWGTAPAWFLEDFKEILADNLGLQEHDIEINTVFKGGNIIRYFGNPSQNRRLRKILNGREIIALQLEFDRALYLDESSQAPIGWRIKSIRNSFTQALKKMCNSESLSFMTDNLDKHSH